MQIDHYAETLLAARNLSDAVRSVLDGESTAFGDVTVNACWRMDEQDFWDSLTELYRVSTDYAIVYQQE